MRIAFIGQKGIGPSVRIGGVEVYVEELATRLASAGHDVTVFCRRQPRRDSPSSGRSAGGVKLKTVPTLRGKLFEAVTSSFFATLAASRGRFDIIHFQGIGPGFFTWLARLLAPQTKVVVTFHSRDYEHTKWPWFGRLFFRMGERVSIRRAHAVVAVAKHIQQYVRQRYGRDITYIPQGVVLPANSPRFDLGKLRLVAKKYVLAVGRLEPHKGFDTLIAAYRALPADLKAIYKLVIIGAATDAKFGDQLKVAAASEPGIMFLGSQPRPVVAALMRQAYLFVLASASEGLSIALLEALASGRPALVSAIPANTEVISDPAWQFEYGSIGQLTSKLAYFLRQPAFVAAMGQRFKRQIIADHNWPKITRHYNALYDNLLE